jgi:hypothetical protein
MGFFDALGRIRPTNPRAEIRRTKVIRDPKAEATGAPAAKLECAGFGLTGGPGGFAAG